MTSTGSRFVFNTVFCVSILSNSSVIRSQSDGLELPIHEIQTITVTAEKQEKSLQETAISVGIIKGDDLEEGLIEDLEDVGFGTAGVTISNDYGKIYIRGVGNEIPLVGLERGVSIYLDTIYLGRSSFLLDDLFDIERIEILRGPQGTLYGRNASGGALRVETRKPEARPFASAELVYGNHGKQRLRAVYNHPLVKDRILLRLALSGNKWDGPVTNPEPDGHRTPGEKTILQTRMSLKVLLGQETDLQFISSWGENDGSGVPLVPSTPGIAATYGARPVSDPFVIANTARDPSQDRSDIFLDTVAQGHTAILTHTFDQVGSLSVQTGWHQVRFDGFRDTDGTEIDLLEFRQSERQKQTFGEVLFQSEKGRSLHWMAGLYGYREKIDWNGTFKSRFVALIDPDHPPSVRLFRSDSKTRAWAGFLQGSMQGKRFEATVGVRYSDEKKWFTDLPDGVTLRESQASWDAVTPRFLLTFRQDENTFFYVSATKGFKSGGFTLSSFSPPFNAETVWSYETGFKLSRFGGRMFLNTSLFHYDYRDLQVQVPDDSGLVLVENAAEATIRGGELELAFLFYNTRLSSSLGYLDGTYDHFLTADPFLGEQDLGGARLTMAPPFTGSLQIHQPVRLKKAMLDMRLAYRWRDQVKHSSFDDPNTTQDAVGLLHASLSLNYKGRYQVGVWARNLTDRHYYTGMIKLGFSPDGVISTNAEPLTYGVRFGASF